MISSVIGSPRVRVDLATQPYRGFADDHREAARPLQRNGKRAVGRLRYRAATPPLGTRPAMEAKLIKYDEIADLALIQMQPTPAGLNPLRLADSNSVEVGSSVHAIGHPNGEYWTYTQGIVSQVRHGYQWTDGKLAHKATVVQTQTPINPGNSGGPLLDDES